MICKACRRRISKYNVHFEILDTVFVEAYPTPGMWGRYDPPGFLCGIHPAVGRTNERAKEDSAILRKVLPAEKPKRVKNPAPVSGDPGRVGKEGGEDVENA